MTSYELLSLLVALLSAVVAFVSLHRTRRLAARQLQLQEAQADFAKFQRRLLEQEEAKKRQADVRLSVAKVDSQNHQLVIANEGQGVARDVVFEIVVPDGRRSFLMKAEMEALLPCTLLGGQSVSMAIAVTMSTARTCLAKITWMDDMNQVHHQNQTLTS